jgi:hypothetical protein
MRRFPRLCDRIGCIRTGLSGRFHQRRNTVCQLRGVDLVSHIEMIP